MKKFIFLFVLIFVNSCSTDKSLSCKFDPEWLDKKHISNEVPGGLNATDCAFYQYSTQNFIKQLRGDSEFLDWMSVYGVFNDKSRILAKPTEWGKQPQYLRDVCNFGLNMPLVVTDLIYQAGNANPLIDQDHNYTYYDARMNKTMYDFILDCHLMPDNRCRNPEADSTRFPPGAQEVKIAWKILVTEDPGDYVTVMGWVKNPITGACSSELLLMVGYHLVMSTEYHPEMIWSSWTHKNNNPLCDNLSSGRSPKKYSYYRAGREIPVNTYADEIPANICNPDPFQGSSGLSGLALEELRASMNWQLRGQVMGKYQLLGALWTDTGQPPAFTNFQTGSLYLAHPEIESYIQYGSRNGNLNCFSCHHYSRKDRALEVSHINDVITNKKLDLSEGRLHFGR